MNSERGAFLAELLQELADDNLFVPEVAWSAWQVVAPHAYNEIVIPRLGDNDTRQYLLTRRAADDPEFPGQPWHIPGSRWKPWRRHPKTRERIPVPQADACAEAARSEQLGRIQFMKEVGTHYWDTFSYRYPISHICLCRSLDPIDETDDVRFFSLGNLPDNIIKPHDEFLALCDKALGLASIW